jgi:hypothetical protein
MAITLNGTPVNSIIGSGTSLSVTLPSSVKSGDIILIIITAVANVSFTPPNGYTIIGSKIISGLITTAIYYHVWQNGDPTSLTFTWGGSSVQASAICGAYTGVDNTNPIDANNGQANSAATNITFPSITVPPGNNTDMLVMLGSQVGSQTYSNASEGTIEQTNSSPGMVWIDFQLTSSGVTGNQTVTSASSNASVGFQVALLPSSIVVAPTISGFIIFELKDSYY